MFVDVVALFSVYFFWSAFHVATLYVIFYNSFPSLVLLLLILYELLLVLAPVKATINYSFLGMIVSFVLVLWKLFIQFTKVFDSPLFLCGWFLPRKFEYVLRFRFCVSVTLVFHWLKMIDKVANAIFYRIVYIFAIHCIRLSIICDKARKNNFFSQKYVSLWHKTSIKMLN